MMGQPYKVEITLEMPESEANKELGKRILLWFNFKTELSTGFILRVRSFSTQGDKIRTVRKNIFSTISKIF